MIFAGALGPCLKRRGNGRYILSLLFILCETDRDIFGKSNSFHLYKSIYVYPHDTVLGIS